MSASIASLLENNRVAERVCIHILSNGISTANEEKLRAFVSHYGRELFFYDISDISRILSDRLGTAADTGSFSPTVMARLFAAEYLPDTVDRYLYLDADTLVLRMIADFYSMDLKGAAAAVCPEPTIYRETRDKLGLGEAEPYFNSGVMLIDRYAYTEQNIAGKCMEYMSEHNGELHFPDQDVLNYALKGRIVIADQSYNFLTNYQYWSFRALKKMSPWYGDCITEKAYNNAQGHPAVVHFAGDERPWINGSFNPYKGAYEAYLKLTPWAGEGTVYGKLGYMFLYHCMNMVTFFAPGIRLLISELYYKRFLERKS